MDQEQELDAEVQTQVIVLADLSFEIRRILEQQTLDQIPLLESQIELQHREFEVDDYFNPPSPSLLVRPVDDDDDEEVEFEELNEVQWNAITTPRPQTSTELPAAPIRNRVNRDVNSLNVSRRLF